MKRIFLTKCSHDAAVPILNDSLMPRPQRSVLLFASLPGGQHTGKRLSSPQTFSPRFPALFSALARADESIGMQIVRH